MTAIANSTTTLTAPAPTAPAASTTPTAPLGATTLPATGPTQDALVAALTQLVTVLTALVDALKGAHAAGGGASSKGGGPEAKGGGTSPIQSPIQMPTQFPTQGGGPAPTAPNTSTGTATATLQSVPAGFSGPTIASSPSFDDLDSVVFSSGSAASAQLGGSADVQFIQRREGSATPVTVSVAAPDGATKSIAVPASGSVQLSSGASVTWSNGGELGFSITRPGQQAITFDSMSTDRVPGFADKVASPLQATEIAELARTLAARYPAA